MENENKVCWGIPEINEILPHRHPFLFVDRVVEFEDGKRILAIKNVTMNEAFFVGHFPGQPVYPGVIMLECIAQAGVILAKKSTAVIDVDIEGKTLYLVGANDCKWRKMVQPGDTMKIEVTFVKRKRLIWIMAGKITVDGDLVAEATLTAAAS